MRRLRREVGKAQQVTIEFPQRGGRRRGAGRKRKGDRPRVPHRTRPRITARDPVHVTLRVLDAAGRLRRRDAYRAIRGALWRVHERADFRVIHVSIQHNHVHLICEAEDRTALSRGVSALKISAARRLNRVLRRTGPVFSDRYHTEIITCPRQARNVISYVLNNWRRHGEHRGVSWRLDPFSSAISHREWAEAREGFAVPEGYELLPVHEPRSWLLLNWRKHHAPISYFETPG